MFLTDIQFVSQNVPSDMCAQRRLVSLRIRESDQSLRCPHEESKMHPVKILIRLRECAGWSESSLGAQAWRNVFWRGGSFIYFFLFFLFIFFLFFIFYFLFFDKLDFTNMKSGCGEKSWVKICFLKNSVSFMLSDFLQHNWSGKYSPDIRCALYIAVTSGLI